MAVGRKKGRNSREAALAGHEAELLGRTSRRQAARPHTDSCDADLHVCPECESSLVYPMDWAPARMRSWQVDLRCPECEWRGAGTYSQDVVDRFDIVLDEGTEAVIDDLSCLTRANMEAEIDGFVRALANDHILPEDF